MSIARVLSLAVAGLAAVGCGGGEPKSEEDRAADVAREYVSTSANSEEAECAETLAAGVDRKLCDELGPLAARINPETKAASVSGSTAKVTVTGAGNNTRLEVMLVDEGGEWKVKRWRGYAVEPSS